MPMGTHSYSRTSRIAAAVILYNPTKEILDNIYCYSNDVDEIIIFDNSSICNTETLSPILSLSNIHYLHEGSNKGIAYALNAASVLARDLKCKYLLTMDQDSRVPKNMVSKLCSEIEKLPTAGLISPFHLNKFNTNVPQNNSVEVVKAAKASGNLISLDADLKIGGFRNEYFIDFVDIEYCWRLRASGYLVFQDNSQHMPHNEGDIRKVKFLFFTFYPFNNSPVRLYYKTRNLLLLYKDYWSSNFKNEVYSETWAHIKNCLKALLFEESKFLKLFMIGLGVFDFLRGREGKINHER